MRLGDLLGLRVGLLVVGSIDRGKLVGAPCMAGISGASGQGLARIADSGSAPGAAAWWEHAGSVADGLAPWTALSTVKRPTAGLNPARTPK